MGGEEQIGLQWTPGSLAICRIFRVKQYEVKAIFPSPPIPLLPKNSE
jgi:hypothetical protein